MLAELGGLSKSIIALLGILASFLTSRIFIVDLLDKLFHSRKHHASQDEEFLNLQESLGQAKISESNVKDLLN